MRKRLLLISALQFGLCLLILSSMKSGGYPPPSGGGMAKAQTFVARGVIQAVNQADRQIIIRHEAISNYMAAMTMPFRVKDARELAGLQRGDEISFRLHVAKTESWVDHLVKIGVVTLPPPATPTNAPAVPPPSPLLDYRFTNELGQAMSLNDFRGQALAITFFYTRCPLPDFCPRLSKNFEEAEQKLEARSDAPTNWHMLSISFDPRFDTPAILKAYGDAYRYDPKHWSFLTGPADKIGELAQGAGVTYASDGGTINHNFRTLIMDTRGHLQMIFPTSGDLSDQIVAEIIKAAGVTNPSVSSN